MLLSWVFWVLSKGEEIFKGEAKRKTVLKLNWLDQIIILTNNYWIYSQLCFLPISSHPVGLGSMELVKCSGLFMTMWPYKVLHTIFLPMIIFWLSYEWELDYSKHSHRTSVMGSSPDALSNLVFVDIISLNPTLTLGSRGSGQHPLFHLKHPDFQEVNKRERWWNERMAGTFLCQPQSVRD